MDEDVIVDEPIYCEYCYGGYCLRNKDELKAIRKDMMKIAKSK